jgi:hypothetical protein
MKAAPNPYILTLTMGTDDLKSGFATFTETFRRLRRTKIWKATVQAGAFFTFPERASSEAHQLLWNMHGHGIIDVKVAAESNLAALAATWESMLRKLGHGGSAHLEQLVWKYNRRAPVGSMTTPRWAPSVFYVTRRVLRAWLDLPDAMLEEMAGFLPRTRLTARFGGWRGARNRRGLGLPVRPRPPHAGAHRVKQVRHARALMTLQGQAAPAPTLGASPNPNVPTQPSPGPLQASRCCIQCGAAMEPGSRVNKQSCSGRCRTAMYRAHLAAGQAQAPTSPPPAAATIGTPLAQPGLQSAPGQLGSLPQASTPALVSPVIELLKASPHSIAELERTLRRAGLTVPPRSVWPVVDHLIHQGLTQTDSPGRYSSRATS